MKNQFKIKVLDQRQIMLLLIIGALSACDRQGAYYDFQALAADGWQRKDTLFFDVDVLDSLTSYKLSVAVRNRSNYPYQNINLSINYSGVDALTTYSADTLHLILANKEGKWKGKGWGGLYQSAFSARNIQITKPGTYRFKIAYTLPDTVLRGINDIGIKLER